MDRHLRSLGDRSARLPKLRAHLSKEHSRTCRRSCFFELDQCTLPAARGTFLACARSGPSFLDRAGQIFALDEFRPENDRAAISRARLFLSNVHGDGFDIWEQERHVHLELNQAQPVLH